MNIITELQVRSFLLTQQRCSCQRDENRIWITKDQVLEVHTFQRVTAMCFVHKEDALDVGIICILCLWNCILKLLNIYDYKFAVILCCRVMRQHLVQFSGEIGTAGRIHNIKIPIGELGVVLPQQIQTVYNKVEPCDRIFLCIIIFQDLITVCCKFCLAGSLRVPDDSALLITIQTLCQRPCRKELWVAHNVFFRNCAFKIKDSVLQYVQ